MGKKKNNWAIWASGLLLISFLFLYFYGDKLGLPFTVFETQFTEGIIFDDFNTGIKVDSIDKQGSYNSLLERMVYDKWTYKFNSGNYTYTGNNPVVPPDIASGNIQDYGLFTSNGFLRIPCSGGGHCGFDINTDFSGKKVEIVGRVEQFTQGGAITGSTSYNLYGGSLTTVYEVQGTQILSQNFVVKIEPSFFNSDEKKIYFNGILTGKTTGSTNPITFDLGGAPAYIFIDYISFEPTFGCDFKQGEILAYDLFNGGETISYSNFEGNVVKFCSQHPTVVHEQDKGTTTTFEIPIAIAKGNSLTIPDNQAWGIFYVLKQEGLSCALNEVYVADNKSCRKIADLEGGLRGELNQKLQEIEALKGRIDLLSSEISQLGLSAEQKRILVENLNAELSRQTQLINSLEATAVEKGKIIANLSLELDRQTQLIKSLQATSDDKGKIIFELNLKVEDQLTMIKSLNLNVEENSKLISNLRLKVDEQSIMVQQLTKTTEEQAIMIKSLTKNVEEQAIIINNLNLNLQEKIRLVSLLQATTEEQFKLIVQMKLSFSDQQIVVNQLQSTIENDAKLISGFELKLSEEAIIIQNLRKTVEEKGQIIVKLTQNIEEQAQIIKDMNLNLEEKAKIIKAMQLSLDKEAILIMSLNLKLEEQAQIIKNLQLSLDEEAILIKSFNLKLEEQAKIIADLDLSLENEKLLVQKLTSNLEEQKLLQKRISELQPESPQTSFKLGNLGLLGGIGVIALIFVFVAILGKKRRKKRK